MIPARPSYEQPPTLSVAVTSEKGASEGMADHVRPAERISRGRRFA